MEIKKVQKNKGAAMMILLFFFIIISMTILLGIVTPVVRELKISGDSLDSRKSYFMAESGIEDIMYRIKNSMEVGTLGDNRVLFIDGTNFPIPTDVVDGLGGQKSIRIEGDVKDRQRSVEVSLTTSSGVSFSYGVLVGQGGIALNGSGTIRGNVYANGPITGDSSAIITGTAISANSPSLTSDQTNGSGNPAYGITFGNANATQDIGQSFKVSTESPLNKVQFYIKKVSTPSDALVKIVSDSNGKPGTTVIASGTLSSSAVTTSYGWVNVSFITNPTLKTEDTYWLVIDASTSNSKYYILGASNGGYGNGLGKIGALGGTWANTTPSGLDYFFNIYLGGVMGIIAGNSGSQWNQLHIGTVSGIAQAHTVNYTNVTGALYCQTGTGNNKSCVSQTDPVYIDYPVSEGNLIDWQNDATSGGVYNGNYSVGWQNGTLGPKKIVGDLTVSGGGVLTVTGNIWVTGNLVLNGGGTIKMASNYGVNDAVIVVDGTITISGGGHATGSGTPGSYLMFYTTSFSSSAASIDGGAGAVILYAPNGTINISGGASLKEATGYRININGGSSITYESGLTDNNFSSGPSGTWSVNSWGESQ